MVDNTTPFVEQFKKDCEALHQRIDSKASQPDSGGWRDISTAPRDGSDILLYDDGNLFVGYWTNWFDNIAQEHRSGWKDCTSFSTLWPKVWQPKPPPPSERGDASESAAPSTAIVPHDGEKS